MFDKKEYDREWHQRNKHQRNVQIQDRTRRISRENVLKLEAYFKDHPCVDCGESDPIVLEFDHVRGVKRKEVSVLARTGFSWETVQAEIDKCEVRCANCHRRVTYKRRNAGV